MRLIISLPHVAKNEPLKGIMNSVFFEYARELPDAGLDLRIPAAPRS
jgi:hypothetical protein